MGDIFITEVHEPSGPDFDGFVDVCATVEQELTPEDPAPTAAEIEAEYFRPRSLRGARAWLARRDGDPVGALAVQIPHVANAVELRPEAWVLPAERRRGVARALLRQGLGASAQDRTRLGAWVHTETAAALCQSLGLEPRQEERCSRLRTADVDHTLLQRWIDGAPARAEGYQVVTWRGPCPDEHLPALCTALDAMADIPVDDLDHEHPPTRPSDVRESEAAHLDAYDPFVALALAPDGHGAGMSLVWASRGRPGFAHQDDTAVVAVHRGRSLGRWLKAANLRLLVETRPQVRTIETYNAESNPWMLAINVDMGFRPFRSVSAYQGLLEPALRILDG